MTEQGKNITRAENWNYLQPKEFWISNWQGSICSMKIKPRINTDIIKRTLTELFTQSVLLWWHRNGKWHIQTYQYQYFDLLPQGFFVNKSLTLKPCSRRLSDKVAGCVSTFVAGCVIVVVSIWWWLALPSLWHNSLQALCSAVWHWCLAQLWITSVLPGLFLQPDNFAHNVFPLFC